MKVKSSILFAVLIAMLAVGCAHVPYEITPKAQRPAYLELREGEEQFEEGRPCLPLDFLGNVVSLPSKLMLWSWSVDSHWIKPETTAALNEYMGDNELQDVKVRVNQYAPIGEWSRLFRNKSVGFGWRYTLGLITTTMYTILPGRLLGGDHYNPYTQTVSLYSNHKGIALHEGGHAKDFSERKWKGTYGFVRLLPIVSLYQEGLATGDAIGYMREKEAHLTEKQAYKILYPAYCTYIGGEIQRFYATPWLMLAVIPGHIAGRVKAAGVPSHGELPLNAPADRLRR